MNSGALERQEGASHPGAGDGISHVKRFHKRRPEVDDRSRPNAGERSGKLASVVPLGVGAKAVRGLPVITRMTASSARFTSTTYASDIAYPRSSASRSAAARASSMLSGCAVTRATRPSAHVNTKGLRRVIPPPALPTGRAVNRVTTNTTPPPRSRISSGCIS